MGLDGGPGYVIGGPGLSEIYRVVRREVLTDRRFPWTPKRDMPERSGVIDMQAGDIRIDIIRASCGKEISRSGCGHTWTEPVAYIVRRRGDHWTVMAWNTPYNLRE